MRDLFLAEALEGRTLFSVDVSPLPPGPPELAVVQGSVEIYINAKNVLFIETPGVDTSILIGRGVLQT